MNIQEKLAQAKILKTVIDNTKKQYKQLEKSILAELRKDDYTITTHKDRYYKIDYDFPKSDVVIHYLQQKCVGFLHVDNISHIDSNKKIVYKKERKNK